MKPLNKLLPPLWWTFTGGTWLWSGTANILSIPSVCTGFLVIICGWFNNSKYKIVAIIADIALVLYTLGFAIFTFMLIVVAPPKPWSAVTLFLMAIVNIPICIKTTYNLFKS